MALAVAVIGLLAESRMTQTLVSEVPCGDARIQVKAASSLMAKLRAAPKGTPAKP